MSLRTEFAPERTRNTRVSSVTIDILMYHSISDGEGPTCVPPHVFRDQMAALAEAEVAVISLDDLVSWRAGAAALSGRSVVITFDDGFLDFAETAYPVLSEHRFPSIVYLPAAHVGGPERWRGANAPPRPLMSWEQISALAEAGVDFGGHSMTHPDLVSLPAAKLTRELQECRAVIAEHTGRIPIHFAPPYGRATGATRQEIRRFYRTSCGTRLAVADSKTDLFDLPRLEMFYFTDIARWKSHLAGRGTAYLLQRQMLRAARDALSKPWSRQ